MGAKTSGKIRSTTDGFWTGIANDNDLRDCLPTYHGKIYRIHIHGSKNKLEYDNHFVSWTADPITLISGYYATKGARQGYVIIAETPVDYRFAIDLRKYTKQFCNPTVASEQEVVAPMSRDNVMKIMKFREFEKGLFK